MRSKRDLLKWIEKYEEAIEEYQNAMERLKGEQNNSSTTLAQRNMNEHLIHDCKNYIKQYERHIYMLKHEVAYPQEERGNLYDSIWEQLLSGEPIKAGRLV
ncbi:hypothetical protein [Bacillus wiedmannii]|uniref:hypothetical protein n=1 Tax=Bacillus wiedmannii TaxID=1890302 RepID=UPI000BFBD03E|nr:hypothetical protein [Bacillus wiedmannii]PHA61730.1 hypothetical protein COE75_18015 [Bacillus wiedmannii]